jgi:hypothetical protein
MGTLVTTGAGPSIARVQLTHCSVALVNVPGSSVAAAVPNTSIAALVEAPSVPLATWVIMLPYPEGGAVATTCASPERVAIHRKASSAAVCEGGLLLVLLPLAALPDMPVAPRMR